LRQIKKILLLVPPAYTFKSFRDINPLPPMGLGYLAAVAESMGMEVRILDCLVQGWNHEEAVDGLLIRVGLPDDEIAKRIAEFAPDVIGINCQFSRQYKIYHRLFALAKQARPESITVAGGAHATVVPEEVLQNPNCDYLLIGEAEAGFKQLLEALQSGGDLGKIDGLGRKEDGRVIINEKKEWIRDLDSIPFPAYHVMELERYFGLPSSHGARRSPRFCPIITSRGCPARCTFCSAFRVWGRKYRVRSVENVLAEMKLLHERYGVTELMFEDDNVTADARRAEKLFRGMIEAGFNFQWDTPNGVGVWSLTNELVDLMKQSGCYKLNFPVESGSQRVLDSVIRKPLDLGKVKSLIAHCDKISLERDMFLVIGMPGETLTDIRTSLRFAAQCRCFNPHISVATPYPGTELFELCRDKGFFATEFSLDDLFIRSFIIRTPDWDGEILRRTLLKGHLYLKFQRLLHDPLESFKWALRKLKDPSGLLAYLRLVNKGG